MGITVWAIVLLASLWVLVKAADYFTDYAEKLGKLLRLPGFIIGVLILAVGTSLPELVTSILGVQAGEPEFLSGTVLGSSIANILLVVGVAVVLCRKKATINWDVVSNDLPFVAVSVFLVAIALIDGAINSVEAVFFLIGYVVYVFYAYYAQKTARSEVKEKYYEQIKEEIRNSIKDAKVGGFLSKIIKPEIQIVIFLAVSLLIVILSSKYVVDSVLNLATLLGFGASALAATVVALGTSLPELMVSISAAKRGNFEMVIGNILGSNIFNIFVVYGVVGLFATLTLTIEMYMILIPFLIGSFFFLWLVLIDKKVTKTEGLMFLLLYVLFIGKMFGLF